MDASAFVLVPLSQEPMVTEIKANSGKIDEISIFLQSQTHHNHQTQQLKNDLDELNNLWSVVYEEALLNKMARESIKGNFDFGG